MAGEEREGEAAAERSPPKVGGSNRDDGGAKARVGVIGTGMLGSAVAARLAKKMGACSVSVYNRTAQKTSTAAVAGAAVLDSPAAVAESSDVILIIVRDADAVREVSFGRQRGTGGKIEERDGIASGCRGGQIVADMSTIGPADSREITAGYERLGIAKIDAPVMGGPDAAAAGSLIAMISGNRDAFEKCRGVLDLFSERTFFLGTRAGTANSVKLAMNMQIAMLALSLAEGITLVGRSGVDPAIFLDVLNSTYFSTGMSRRKAYNMIDKSQKPTFTLANLRKDIEIMAGTADSLGLDLPMITRAGEVYEEALGQGHGGLDYTGIIRHIEERGLRDGGRLHGSQK